LGGDDSITFRDWYQVAAGVSNRSVSSLQVIAEVMDGFDAASSNPLLNRKVAQFDFGAAVRRFDQELANDPGLTAWSMVDALYEYHVAGSDFAALGGDLAYQYGAMGTLAGLGTAPIQSGLASAQFGVAPQTLQPLTSLQIGTSRLF
jgi:hypothetical protein